MVCYQPEKDFMPYDILLSTVTTDIYVNIHLTISHVSLHVPCMRPQIKKEME